MQSIFIWPGSRLRLSVWRAGAGLGPKVNWTSLVTGEYFMKMKVLSFEFQQFSTINWLILCQEGSPIVKEIFASDC